jgi:RNA polymerase sigma-70 factor (ECF subfamily)
VNSFCEQERAILQRCREGSKKAFEAVVGRYMKDAYFIALGLVGNRDDALELSQEAFLRAYCNINRLNPKGRFFPWFYQILRNLCFTHLKKAKIRQQHSVEKMNGEKNDTAIADSFDPEMVAERNEIRDKIWAAISLLNDKHREVIILRHFHSLSYERISEILFCNKGTVMSRLYHARKRLKEILDCTKGGLQK